MLFGNREKSQILKGGGGTSGGAEREGRSARKFYRDEKGEREANREANMSVYLAKALNQLTQGDKAH